MLDPGSNRELPPIPAKRYFTIGEVSELCDVKPHVLRYWETEFPSLKPVKRRGNRRYYQRHDVLMIRQIRGLLYEAGLHHHRRPPAPGGRQRRRPHVAVCVSGGGKNGSPHALSRDRTLRNRPPGRRRRP
jgi:hypothetical protein